MVDLKACQRCGGDMTVEEMLGERELVCLQCGHRTFAPAAGLAARQPRRESPRLPARAAVR